MFFALLALSTSIPKPPHRKIPLTLEEENGQGCEICNVIVKMAES